jgi:hypothetical protein
MLTVKSTETAEAEKDHKLYDASMASIADATAFERQPDIFVSHVATFPLQQPINSEKQAQYDLRGGRKIYLQSGAVIVELKPGPAASNQV